MNRDRIQSMDNTRAVNELRSHYPSVQDRHQYFNFTFGSERDAQRFARDYNGHTPNSAGGTFVVQLKP
jgi:hypothetical protein